MERIERDMCNIWYKNFRCFLMKFGILSCESGFLSLTFPLILLFFRTLFKLVTTPQKGWKGRGLLLIVIKVTLACIFCSEL